jgi:hypothetical protein
MALRESGLTSIDISASVEIFCEAYFQLCISLASVTFSADSKLSRLEQSAFSQTGLTSIALPASVEIIVSEWFRAALVPFVPRGAPSPDRLEIVKCHMTDSIESLLLYRGRIRSSRGRITSMFRRTIYQIKKRKLSEASRHEQSSSEHSCAQEHGWKWNKA